MSPYDSYGVQQQSGPPRRTAPAWWWLPEQERRRRKEQRRQWQEHRRRNKKSDRDCCDGCDCLGELADPCMIALIPVMMLSALKAAVGAATGRRGTRAADPAAPVPDGVLAAGMYGAVRYYRTRISPARAPRCPYTPSCSTYAVQALHRHGAVRGARLTAGRLLRCRPGTKGGSDPVPGR
ncbi:membrane protein insertion efficiency factor YidD [Streptomyces sp. CB03911]|uniref:membrane protein insertion efficiency factor YidD n=1 Tax=Streptomyces sp. CB03911 TaxID=1804758 RepID=UPI000ABF4AF9|nr:membrane protein insertion efficiency factor YidD [Streptomyces sp. CB03911]